MVKPLVVSLAGLILLTGCTPGYSINPVSLSPVGATFEYTYSVNTEYPATVQAAEAHCQKYGKHAKPVGQPVRLDVDRATASFECVSGT